MRMISSSVYLTRAPRRFLPLFTSRGPGAGAVVLGGAGNSAIRGSSLSISGSPLDEYPSERNST